HGAASHQPKARLAWIFHTNEAGAPACCRLRPFEPHKPATCRRSGLSAIRGGCEISRLEFPSGSAAAALFGALLELGGLLAAARFGGQARGPFGGFQAFVV